MTNQNKEKDEITGVETTGHEWDGIKELNNPAPRWWLWILYLTIIWSVGYWVVYPAFPTLSGEGHRGGTTGILQQNQYTELKKSQADIMQRRSAYQERFTKASFEDIYNNEDLYSYAMAGGASAFKDNCATCHGSGGAGSPGYPNLNDDEWIWGGSLEEIHDTITYGIRNANDNARFAQMPAFADMLDAEEIEELAHYVSGLSEGKGIALTGEETDEAYEALPLGAQLFSDHCATCHGFSGEGIKEMGAPSLADAIWLKSKDGSVNAIASQIRDPKHGVMPAWEGRLDEDTIRQLTIYVHSLGGGE